MSKLFISFLGTGNYQECFYEVENQKSNIGKFVQTATVGFFCSDFIEDDRIVIFCTEKAEEKHFISLKREFTANNLPVPDLVKIPDGSSEEKLWEIFQIVMDEVKDKDQIIFDITHSFRSLPMLMTILLQYLKVLKNISIQGVYYGAFEKLGYAKDVELMPVSERIAPIFDLTPFFSLYDWSIAINNFIKFGNTELLNGLSELALKPIQCDSNLRNQDSTALKKIVDFLNKFTKAVHLTRGPEITRLQYEKELIEPLDIIQGSIIPPLTPLIESLKYEFKDFKKNDIENGLRASLWCFEHKMYQQGLTILQESIITIFSEKLSPNSLSDRDKRDAVSLAFKITNDNMRKMSNQIEDENISGNAKVEKIKHNPDKDVSELCKLIKPDISVFYEKLKSIRNDINHSGYSDNSDKKPEKLIVKINELKKQVKVLNLEKL